MLTACWSAKGGAGTTVVAVTLALLLARSAPEGAVLADLAGDGPAALGMPDPPGLGLLDWLAAGPEVPPDALGRLEVEAGPGLRLLPRGGSGHPRLPPNGETAGAEGQAPSPPESSPQPLAPTGNDDGERLAVALAGLRPVVVDCGSSPSGAALAVAAAAGRSLLVIRPCYLALRRALAAPIRPSGVVLVTEPGRTLGRHDIEDVLGVPVRAQVRYDPAVARAVDAGVLASRVPRGLERALREAA